MPLACTGINHHTAPLALRERLAFGPEAQRDVLRAPEVRDLGSSAGLGELVILSTCNRTELYAAPVEARASQDISDALLQLLAAISGLPLPTLRPYTYRNTGLAALRHLCRVATGLDSMVVGESEVLGQVAKAFQTAASEGATGPVLEAAFRTATRAGRRARTETGICRHPASVSSEAVRLLTQVAGDLSGLSVLVVGTGKMGQLAGQALRESGVRRLSVVSRTAAHAEAVAHDWGAGAQSLGWHDLAAAVTAADAILCSTGAPHAVVTRELVERAIGPQGDGRRRIIIDIAVPRDVEPEVGRLPGVQLFDLDALQERLRDNLDLRRREIPAVERIVSEEIEHFETWRQGMTLRPLLTQMHARGETIRQREVERLRRRVGPLPPELAAELEAFSQSLVTKLLHEPTRRLRETRDPEQIRTYSDVTRRLFGLDGGPQGTGPGPS